MTSRRDHATGDDWASRLEPSCPVYEERLERAVGRRATVRCDWQRDVLVVEMPDLHPSKIDDVADELSTLWPGFLAPAGVSLRLVGGDEWDNEAMALRSHRLRG